MYNALHSIHSISRTPTDTYQTLSLSLPLMQARKRPASVIGDFAIDLKVLADAGAFQGEHLGKHAVHVFSEVLSIERGSIRLFHNINPSDPP